MQIIGVIKEAESGVSVTELCRRYGLNEGTVYRWKAKYGGMSVSDARKLESLEDENRRLKNIVADLTLDNQALKAVISKHSRAQGEEGSREIYHRQLSAQPQKGLRSHQPGQVKLQLSGQAKRS